MALKEFLIGIADRLRKNLGTSGTINASDFADKIDEVYEAGKTDEKTAFWQQFQKYNISTLTPARKSYTQAFMNWGAAEIKPLYTVSYATTDTRYMFYSCTGITSTDDLDFSEWIWGDSEMATNSNIAMFQNCSNLEALDWGAQFKFAPKNITQMFKGCSKLTTLENFDVSKLTNATSAFAGCTALENISFMGTYFRTDVEGLIIDFSECTSLSGESVANIKAAACPYIGTTIPDSAANTIKTIKFPTHAPKAWAEYIGGLESDWGYEISDLESHGWTVIC